MSYPGRHQPGRSSTFAYGTHAPDSWYPSNPLASSSSPPSSLHHSQSWSQESSTPLQRGRFQVSIFEARDIKGDEWNNLGKADPYAKIKLGGKNYGGEERTAAHKDAGSHPKWNQLFTFYVLKEDPEYNELKISLYNRNRFPRSDDFLGHLTILNMGQIMSENENMALETWYPVILNGEQKGEILLSFDMLPMSAEDMLISTPIRKPSMCACSGSARSGATGSYQIRPLKDKMKIAQLILTGMSVVIALIAL